MSDNEIIKTPEEDIPEVCKQSPESENTETKKEIELLTKAVRSRWLLPKDMKPETIKMLYTIAFGDPTAKKGSIRTNNINQMKALSLIVEIVGMQQRDELALLKLQKTDARPQVNINLNGISVEENEQLQRMAEKMINAKVIPQEQSQEQEK